MIGKEKRILIADDEQNIRLLVSRALSKDYVVLEAENGEKAVNLALHQTPDLILMDIMMPVKDGITALHEIKTNQRTKAIPVIMLTGVGYELNRELAESMGASGYITKPLRLQELLDVINQVLRIDTQKH